MSEPALASRPNPTDFSVREIAAVLSRTIEELFSFLHLRGTANGAANRFARLLLVGAVCLMAGSKLAFAADDNRPVLTVVMASSTILANHNVDVHVWVQNPADTPIRDLKLSLVAPGYLSLGTTGGGKCNAPNGNVVTLAPLLAAHGSLNPPANLCVSANSNVTEEDVSVVFALSSSIATAKGSQTEIVVSEQKLSIGLLGTDTVGGVSLRLTGFFLPGALLLLMLGLDKFPGVDRLSGTDSAIISVIVSILLSDLTSWFMAPAQAGVSLLSLGIVSGAAIVLGGLLVGGHRYVMYCTKKALEALLVTENDDEVDKLHKALKSANGDFDPVTVIGRRKTYFGAAAAKTSSGGVVVLGWYKLETRDPELQKKLKALLDARRYDEALEMRGSATLGPSNILREKRDGEEMRGSTEGQLFQVPAWDKPEITRGWPAGLDINDPPLILG